MSARLLVVSGDDFAALAFKSKYDPDRMTGAQIRELVHRHRKGLVEFDTRVTMKIIDIEGPINRDLFTKVRRTVGDYDSLKHTDCWLFEE